MSDDARERVFQAIAEYLVLNDYLSPDGLISALAESGLAVVDAGAVCVSEATIKDAIYVMESGTNDPIRWRMVDELTRSLSAASAGDTSEERP